MQRPASDLLPRTNSHGWELTISADNGIDLLQYNLPVGGIGKAAIVASTLAEMIAKHGQEEYTQMTLTNWRVEIRMSAPTGAWRNDGQRVFAARVNEQAAVRSAGTQ
jgi:hypothetical protein